MKVSIEHKAKTVSFWDAPAGCSFIVQPEAGSGEVYVKANNANHSNTFKLSTCSFLSVLPTAQIVLVEVTDIKVRVI